MPKKKEKENDTKKIVLIVVAILAFIATIVFVVMTIKGEETDDTSKINGIDVTKNKDILKDTKIDTLDVTNQVLYNRNDSSIFGAIIKNNTSSDYYIKELYIKFTVNKEEKRILATKDTTIKTNDQKVINISFDEDILDTTKIEYELVK